MKFEISILFINECQVVKKIQNFLNQEVMEKLLEIIDFKEKHELTIH